MSSFKCFISKESIEKYFLNSNDFHELINIKYISSGYGIKYKDNHAVF